jgi:hypothetical protein
MTAGAGRRRVAGGMIGEDGVGVNPAAEINFVVSAGGGMGCLNQ